MNIMTLKLITNYKYEESTMIPKNITVLRDGNNVAAKTAKGCVFSDDVLEVFGEGHSAILANDKTKVHFLFLSDMVSLDQIADTLWDYQIFVLGDGEV